VSITTLPPRSIQQASWVRHWVLVSLLVITAINYIQRNAINPAATTITADLGLKLTEIGLIMGAFFLSYTITMVPSGMLAQFIGAKRALVLYAAGWSLAIAACALTHTFLGLYAGRIAMGIFQAGIFPCATLILKVWYPASRRGLATALLTSFMLIGGVLGSFLTGALLEDLGWRGVFMLYAVPGLLWAAWFAWWFRSRPEDHPRVNQAELDIIADAPQVAATPAALPPRATTTSEQIVAHRDGIQVGGGAAHTADTAVAPQGREAPVVLRRGLLMVVLTITLICIQQGFRAGANRLFDTWMPPYYELERGTTKEVAAYLSGTLQAVGVVGVIVGGLLTDEVLRRTRSRRAARNGVALVSLLGPIGFYFLAWAISNVYLATAVFSLGVFVFMFSSPVAYALTMDVGGRYLAVIFSLMNMAGNLGAFAFVSFLPNLVDWGGWNMALGVFVLMHLAAAACWLVLDPEASIDNALPARTE
jgi:ACS family glucarate transporter-like MFS transporter